MRKLMLIFLLCICMVLVSWIPLTTNETRPKGPKGKKTFDRLCSGCHGADAKGITSFSPPLSRSKIVLGPANKFIRVVLKGSEELKTGNKNIMPGHADLKDRRIANLLTYIRNNFGNNAAAVTPDEVKVAREKL